MPDAADEILAIGQMDRLSSERKTVLTSRKASTGNSLPSSIVPLAGAAKCGVDYLHDAIKSLRPHHLLAVPGLLWLLVFAIAPLGFLAVISFWTSTIFGLSESFTLDNYRAIFRDPVYFGVLLSTLRVALLTTAFSLIVGYPIAWYLTRLGGMKKNVCVLLLFMPFWTSYVVRTFVWLPMLGRTGLVNELLLWAGITTQPLDWLLYNEGTVYVGLVYVYSLYMILPIYLSLDRLDPRLLEAGADLGASPHQTFRRIVLPLSMPGVVSGSVMVFLLACGAYVTPQLLGGPSGIMFGNIIASQFLNNNNWAFGAALALVLISVVFAGLLISGRRLRLDQVFIGGAH